MWRDSTDPIPAIASACEVYPGRTPYTKMSENEVGYTSALGRALGYMGFGIDRSIATSDDIQNAGGTLKKAAQNDPGAPTKRNMGISPTLPPGQITESQKRFIKALGHTGSMPTSSGDASTLIENLKKQKEATAEEPF